MILKTCKTKISTLYYVHKSFRTDKGKCTSKNVERLGTFEDLKARFGESDLIGETKKYTADLTAAEMDMKKILMVNYAPTKEKDYSFSMHRHTNS